MEDFTVSREFKVGQMEMRFREGKIYSPVINNVFPAFFSERTGFGISSLLFLEVSLRGKRAVAALPQVWNPAPPTHPTEGGTLLKIHREQNKKNKSRER